MNWDKFYLIVLDKGGFFDSFDSKKFHKNLTEAEGITAWWHYLDSAYIIKVGYEVTALNVSQFIQQIAPKKRFFTTEITLDNYNGYLPQQAWDWINKNKF